MGIALRKLSDEDPTLIKVSGNRRDDHSGMGELHGYYRAPRVCRGSKRRKPPVPIAKRSETAKRKASTSSSPVDAVSTDMCGFAWANENEGSNLSMKLNRARFPASLYQPWKRASARWIRRHGRISDGG